jgi:hypothetical protein
MRRIVGLRTEVWTGILSNTKQGRYSVHREVCSVGTRTPIVRQTEIGLQLPDGMGGCVCKILISGVFVFAFRINRWIGKDSKGNGWGPDRGAVPARNCRDLRKTMRNLDISCPGRGDSNPLPPLCLSTSFQLICRSNNTGAFYCCEFDNNLQAWGSLSGSWPWEVIQCGKRERAGCDSRESEGGGELTFVLPHNQVVDFRCLRMLPPRVTALRVHCHVGSVTPLC